MFSPVLSLSRALALNWHGQGWVEGMGSRTQKLQAHSDPMQATHRGSIRRIAGINVCIFAGVRSPRVACAACVAETRSAECGPR